MEEKFYLTDRHADVLQLEELPSNTLKAILALIDSKINGNCFAKSFPEVCPDGGATCGTDQSMLQSILNGEMKGIYWPVMIPNPHNGMVDNAPYQTGGFTGHMPTTPYPKTEAILEMLEFCFKHFHKPQVVKHHGYMGHDHFAFPAHEDGKQEFASDINRLFHRNGLPYKMNFHGKIDMQFDLAQEGLLADGIPKIEDTVTALISEATLLLREPKGSSHQAAIEKLWDAFERTKTLAGDDKKKSVETILRKASGNDHVFLLLNDEAQSLTAIGNQFRIRHFETDKTPLTDMRHIEYLFFRMYALLKLMLETLEQSSSAV